MKIAYRKISLGNKNKEKLAQINAIVEDYQAQGYRLTLRQLYYQLVTTNTIPNKKTEYQKLSILLKEGRMAGIVDWDAIEDRDRVPKSPGAWSSPASILRSAAASYNKYRREGQETYLEVWVEKNALSEVLKRVTMPYHVPILVNRGYGSATSMHDAYNRIREAQDNGQRAKILYFGDHDPSGLDMVRDIKRRMNEFIDGGDGLSCEIDFEIEAIALTTAQVRQYNPPPNPAKLQDPRAVDYIAQFGEICWEIDALTPKVLNDLVKDNIEANTDMKLYNSIVAQENRDIAKLNTFIKTFEK